MVFPDHTHLLFLVVITADAVHGGRGGEDGGGGHRENCFMAFNYCENLNYMSSNCKTEFNH